MSDSTSNEEEEEEQEEVTESLQPAAAKRPRCLDQDEDLWVNWGKMARGETGKRKSLSKIFTSPGEIDRLVGWATHLDGESKTSSDPKTLAGLDSHTPLRPSMLSYIHDEFVKILIRSNEQDLWQCFDTSALIALGMIWEEFMTANLLPLAKEHAERCTRLMEDDTAAGFGAWTLPPDEAILELSRNGIRTQPGYLATAKPVDRTCLAEETIPRHEENDQIAMWCKSHDTTIDKVQQMWPLFKVFFPNIYKDTFFKRKSRDNEFENQQGPPQKVATDEENLEQHEEEETTSRNTVVFQV